jgi:hypothetical protein
MPKKKQSAREIKLNRQRYIPKTIGMWIRQYDAVEHSSLLTRERLDEWLAINGITYEDKIYLYTEINYRKRDPSYPDRLLRIRKFTEKDMIDGKYPIAGKLYEMKEDDK